MKVQILGKVSGDISFKEDTINVSMDLVARFGNDYVKYANEVYDKYNNIIRINKKYGHSSSPAKMKKDALNHVLKVNRL
jgi:hypothetical protein